MAADPRKRQKKLQRKTAKRKEKKKQLARSELQVLTTRLMQAARYPVLHCWVSESTLEQGWGYGVLSRELPGDEVAVGLVFLDVYCIGVKDTSAQIDSRVDYDERLVAGLRAKVPTVDLSPPAFRKLVEGAVEFARKAGFEPDDGYRHMQLLFGDIDPTECKQEFTYGKDGIPVYMSGGDDTPAEVAEIRSTLMRTCGEGNFRIVTLRDGYDDEDDYAGWLRN